MHPILGHLRHLALYLLAWIPLGAILVYFLVAPGHLSWSRAFALLVPLCAIYAFVCLSAWYICRSARLESITFTRLVSTHLTAAVMVSVFWLLVARALAAGLSSLAIFSDLEQQMGPIYPLLFGSGVLLYLLSVALHYSLLSIELSREHERREIQARLLARDSELKALKAQVNPHFLFNSLNSISALTTIDAARAREMCILLADFLRSTIGLGERASIPLGDELALVRSYLSVEKVRFGSRFELQEKIEPEALVCLVPPLLLQPVVENAISHGISTLTEGGWIRLAIGCGNGQGDISIVIENNFDPEMPARRGTGTGLKNVRQRLHMLYGNRASIQTRTEGDSFRVALSLPAQTTDGQR